MPDRPVAPLLLAVLVVLSGCSALPPGPANDGPAGQASATPSLDDVDLPPGVREDRVAAAPLVAAHAAALRNASRVVVRETRLRTAAGNRTSRTVARLAADGRLVVNSTGQARGATGTVATYVGEHRIYRKLTARGETTYRTTARTRRAVVAERGRAGSVATLRSTLRAANLTPTGVRTVNGTPLVVLEGPMRSPGNVTGPGNASVFEATLLVSERGVVNRLSMVAGDRNGSPGGTTTMRVRDVDETTVERPAWVADALAATNRTTAAATSGPRRPGGATRRAPRSRTAA